MLRGKRITLLIAHPDDEAMFFSPTLLSLAPHNDISVLCLSSGDADGLGAIRKGELVESCRRLGIKRDGDVTVIEHEYVFHAGGGASLERNTYQLNMEH